MTDTQFKATSDSNVTSVEAPRGAGAPKALSFDRIMQDAPKPAVRAPEAQAAAHLPPLAFDFQLQQPAAPAQDLKTDKSVLAKPQDVTPAEVALRKDIEKVLWGDSTKSENARSYLNATAMIFNLSNDMAGLTDKQQKEFNQKFLDPKLSVAEKRAYVDTFTKDEQFKKDANDLLTLGGDKIDRVFKWHESQMPDVKACAQNYQKAIAADANHNSKEAQQYWNKAQEFPLQSLFLSAQLEDPSIIRIDAKMSGDHWSLSQLATREQDNGDLKAARKTFGDSIEAADIGCEKNEKQSKQIIADACKSLTDDKSLTSDQKLQIALTTLGHIRALTGPVEARINATMCLTALAADGKGHFQAGPGGDTYAQDVWGWLREGSAAASQIDTKSLRLIGETLAEAAKSNELLREPENSDSLRSVISTSKFILGGDFSINDAEGKPVVSHFGGIVNLPETVRKVSEAFKSTRPPSTTAVPINELEAKLDGV